MGDSRTSQGPTKLDFKIDPDGDHSVGTYEYTDPDSGGKFLIRVKGQAESIRQYGETTQIVYLRLAKTSQDLDKTFGAFQTSTLESKRKWWHAQLDVLQKTVDQANLYQLNDPTWLWRQRPGATDAGLERKFSYQTDRLIEIEPENLPREKGSHYLSMYFDPTHIRRGGLDVYMPRVALGGLSSGIWGRVEPRAGNPDLYLWLYCLEDGGTNPRNHGLSGHPAGQPDEVWAQDDVSECQQGGIWRLHVYGATDADYDIKGSWRIEVRL